MKYLIWLGVGVLSLVVLVSVQVVSIAADDMLGKSDPSRAYGACGGRTSTDECTAYAHQSSGATIYAKPNPKAQVLEHVEYGMYILLTESAKEADMAKWIRTYTVLDNPDPVAKKKTVTHFGYVRRAEVILDTDFRRVVGCWPLKYLKDPDGGYDYYPGETYFTTKGIASYPHHPVTVREYGEQHTYYAEGIFTVRHDKYSNRGYLGHATLDYTNRTVKFAGATPLKEPEQVQWYSPEELKGCKAIPTVEQNTRAPNPKAFKEQ